MSSIPTKPRAVDRCALEDGEYHKSDEIGNTECYHNICCNAEPSFRENPQVKEHDRDFRERKASNI